LLKHQHKNQHKKPNQLTPQHNNFVLPTNNNSQDKFDDELELFGKIGKKTKKSSISFMSEAINETKVENKQMSNHEPKIDDISIVKSQAKINDSFFNDIGGL